MASKSVAKPVALPTPISASSGSKTSSSVVGKGGGAGSGSGEGEPSEGASGAKDKLELKPNQLLRSQSPYVGFESSFFFPFILSAFEGTTEVGADFVCDEFPRSVDMRIIWFGGSYGMRRRWSLQRRIIGLCLLVLGMQLVIVSMPMCSGGAECLLIGLWRSGCHVSRVAPSNQSGPPEGVISSQGIDCLIDCLFVFVLGYGT